MNKLGIALVASGLSLALPHAPAWAASPMTQAFLGNVAANLAVLDTSSRLAAHRADSTEVTAYAESEATEASQMATALVEATPADVRFATALVSGGLVTGRSVAVTGMTGRPAAVSQESAGNPGALEAANSRVPATADLSTLKGLRGAAFDRLYFTMQLDALSQIESDYRTYIKQGDDPAIARLAHEQLPALMKRLEALTKV